MFTLLAVVQIDGALHCHVTRTATSSSDPISALSSPPESKQNQHPEHTTHTQHDTQSTQRTRNFGPCKSPKIAMGCEYFSSILRMICTNSCFCSVVPCEKFNRKTSAPAKNNVSIISNVDDAGPNVATCLVDFLHRCATMGGFATVVVVVVVVLPLVYAGNFGDVTVVSVK